MRIFMLEGLIDPEEDLELPIAVDRFEIKETLLPATQANLKTMHKLGILTADAIMSLIAQAPIDPINLARSLMQMMPGGWTFATADFSMFRVLSRDDKKQVSAALRVDLIQGDTLMALVRNKKGQLVELRSLVFTPGGNQTALLDALCADAVTAAKRETE